MTLCTWLPCSTTPGSRARCPTSDFTVSSAALAREFTDSHHVPADMRELVANAITMHYTPALASNPVPRPTSYLRRIVDVFGLAATRCPMQFASASSRSTRGWASSGSSPGFSSQAKQVPRGRAWYLPRFAMSDLSIRLAPFRG